MGGMSHERDDSGTTGEATKNTYDTWFGVDPLQATHGHWFAHGSLFNHTVLTAQNDPVVLVYKSTRAARSSGAQAQMGNAVKDGIVEVQDNGVPVRLLTQ